MNEDELTPHVEELKRVLGDRISDEELMIELNKYLNEYHVSIDATKRGIIKKYGGTPASQSAGFVTANSVVKKIVDLDGTEKMVDITAKVISVSLKESLVRGLPKKMLKGTIADDSGSVFFTLWDPEDTELVAGSVYNFKNCYCTIWNDKPQVNIGTRGRIEQADIKIETAEVVVQSSEPVECKIASIKDGMGSVTVTAKIISIDSKKIISKDVEKTIFSGLMADETGKIQFTAWSDFSIGKGDSICVKNAYVRSWKSIPQLNLGEKCEVTKVDEITLSEDAGDNKKTIEQIYSMGGGIDITIEGQIVDVRQGSGIIRRCPVCNRSVLNGSCSAHGNVEGKVDLRLKVVIDDGTGAMGAIINRTETEKITNVSLSDAEQLAATKGEGAVSMEIGRMVLMKRVKLFGNVMCDDFGPNMLTRSIEKVKLNTVEEASKLLEEVEGSI